MATQLLYQGLLLLHLGSRRHIRTLIHQLLLISRRRHLFVCPACLGIGLTSLATLRICRLYAQVLGAGSRRIATFMVVQLVVSILKLSLRRVAIFAPDGRVLQISILRVGVLRLASRT